MQMQSVGDRISWSISPHAQSSSPTHVVSDGKGTSTALDSMLASTCVSLDASEASGVVPLSFAPCAGPDDTDPPQAANETRITTAKGAVLQRFIALFMVFLRSQQASVGPLHGSTDQPAWRAASFLTAGCGTLRPGMVAANHDLDPNRSTRVRRIDSRVLIAAMSAVTALPASVGVACRTNPSEPTVRADARDVPLSPPEASNVFAGFDHDTISASLETDQGVIRCKIDRSHAPRGAALFVGFATGKARWRDPRTKQPTDRPLYDHLDFFRAIPEVMIQTGCPLNDGTGEPGYRIEVESSADDPVRLSQPGALVLARYTPPPNRTDPNAPAPGLVLGSQFAVLLSDMHHLAGQVSVIGRCADLDVAAAIARRVGTDKQRSMLLRVSFDRGTAASD